MLSAELSVKRERLLELIKGFGSCAVALSGGVDSAVVARAAYGALGKKAIALTGRSASVAPDELEMARSIAELIGIEHRVIDTREFDNPDYVRNASDRCYHCKTELYSGMERVAGEMGFAVLANGANVDDQGDHRPGMIAAGEHRVRSPLLECGITKAEVRALAKDWGLPIWDKPAAPCLSSRVAYGEAVTPERLAMIDAAEKFLRAQGFREFRVRFHAGDLARIEAPVESLARFAEPEFREEVLAELRRIGFKFVTLDLAGFRSGSLNDLLPVESLRILS